MSDSDESLDFKSEKFDPLKALYSKNLVLPCPQAKQYDNLSKYTSVVLKGIPKQGPKKKKEKKEDEPQPSTSQPLRRFLPHQMPVPGPPRRARTLRNVLTRCEESGPPGPLSVLATCMQRRLRVKIYTRHMSGVRGYVEAFIAAFDKHWNMALEDVREVWVRRRRPRVPAFGDEGEQVSKRWRNRGGARPPKVTATPVKGGQERCERYVGQLMIRGEQVVLVSVLDLPPVKLPAAPSSKTKPTAMETAVASMLNPELRTDESKTKPAQSETSLGGAAAAESETAVASTSKTTTATAKSETAVISTPETKSSAMEVQASPAFTSRIKPSAMETESAVASIREPEPATTEIETSPAVVLMSKPAPMETETVAVSTSTKPGASTSEESL